MIFEPIFEFGPKLVLIHREIQLRDTEVNETKK